MLIKPLCDTLKVWLTHSPKKVVLKLKLDVFLWFENVNNN